MNIALLRAITRLEEQATTARESLGGRIRREREELLRQGLIDEVTS